MAKVPEIRNGLNWLSVAERLGIPVTILAVLVLGIWQGTTWIGTEILLPYFKVNNETLRQIQSVNQEQNAALVRLEAANRGRSEILRDILQSQKATASAVNKLLEKP
jgi:lysophospholipid acyltransferase (LPLAT)-like uncharacterized protein